MAEEDCIFDNQYPNFTGLDPGQMIIWAAALNHLEENIEHLIFRAEHYGDYNCTKLDYLERLRHLANLTKQIRRTNQGEG